MSTKASEKDDGTTVDPQLVALMLMMGLLKPAPPPPMHKKGDVLKGFEFLGMLGKGGFGEVWAVKKNDKLFAIKSMKNDDSAEQELLFSDKLHLNCPFLVKYYESFKSDDGKIAYIVMELCQQGDLDDLVYGLNPDKSRKLDYAKGIGLQPHRIIKIFTQLVLALHELHQHKIVHRDLKLGNVFVDEDDNIKIGDFGASRVLSTVDEMRKTMIGTPVYMSPEQYLDHTYGQGVDLWALGVMAYELCMGDMPFKGKTRDELEEKIKIGKYEPIKKLVVPNEIIAAISGLLTKDPKARPTTGALLKIPIIQECAIDSGLAKYFPKDISVKVTPASSGGGGWSSTSPPPPAGGGGSAPTPGSPPPSKTPAAAADPSSLDKEDFPRATTDTTHKAFQEILRAASAGQPLFSASIVYMYGGKKIEIRQPIRPFAVLKLAKTAGTQDVKRNFMQLIRTSDRLSRALVCLSQNMAMAHVHKQGAPFIKLDGEDESGPLYRFDAASPIVWVLTGNTPALRALAGGQAKQAAAGGGVKPVKYIKTSFHESLLYLAARSNMVDVAEQLLELGSFINDMRSGSSVLNAATYYEHDYMSHYLIRRGANPYAKKPGGGHTPLDEAAAPRRAGLNSTAARPIPTFLRNVLSLREMGEAQHIRFNEQVVAYRLPKTLEDSSRRLFESSWYCGWHGTQQKFVQNIVQYGLLKPGTSVGGGTTVSVPTGRPTDGIYITKAIKNECAEAYTEKLSSLPPPAGSTQGLFCVLVEAVARPGYFAEQNVGSGGYKVARADKADSVVVTAVALVSLDFIRGPASSLAEGQLFALLRGR